MKRLALISFLFIVSLVASSQTANWTQFPQPATFTGTNHMQEWTVGPDDYLYESSPAGVYRVPVRGTGSATSGSPAWVDISYNAPTTAGVSWSAMAYMNLHGRGYF